RRGGHHRSPRTARLGPGCDDRSSFRGRGPAGRGRPARARFAGALSVATALRRSRRLTWLAVAAVAVVLLGLALTLVALSARSAAPTGATATAAQTPPAASPKQTPSPTPSTARQEQQRYRAYVPVVLTNGTALAGAMAGLQECRASRARCEQRIAEASSQVEQFQRALSANPAPACLSAADQRLRDGLSFEARGLDLAE